MRATVKNDVMAKMMKKIILGERRVDSIDVEDGFVFCGERQGSRKPIMSSANNSNVKLK